MTGVEKRLEAVGQPGIFFDIALSADEKRVAVTVPGIAQDNDIWAVRQTWVLRRQTAGGRAVALTRCFHTRSKAVKTRVYRLGSSSRSGWKPLRRSGLYCFS
jgi:hypothetical protein